MDAETEIIHLNEKVLEYKEAGEVDKLKPLLSNYFTIIRAGGLKRDW